MLVITGTMGAGKSTVLAEASDILSLRQIPHAALDLDALGVAYLPSGDGSDGVMYANLESVCNNYVTRGVTRLLLARAMETRAELELCRGAAAAKNAIVCRLTASMETMQERVKKRELGIMQGEFVARVKKLNGILDGAGLENFSIVNENRSLSEVARELLVKAGWISD